MSESAPDTSKNPPIIRVELPGMDPELAKRIGAYIETCIMVEMGNLLKYVKIREEKLMDLIEMNDRSTRLFLKEVNYKLGNMRGQITKEKTKEFDSLEDALEHANKIRAENGLKPISRADFGLPG